MERSKRKRRKRKGKKIQTLAKKKQTQNTQIMNHITITKA
jgi:hypothetical protein